MNDSPCYIKNPDVIVKEEDDDGALVFCPDTERILVLNPMAFYILKQFETSQTVAEVIDSVAESYEDVPLEEMEEQVSQYIEQMVNAGFLGTIEK